MALLRCDFFAEAKDGSDCREGHADRVGAHGHAGRDAECEEHGKGEERAGSDGCIDDAREYAHDEQQQRAQTQHGFHLQFVVYI